MLPSSVVAQMLHTAIKSAPGIPSALLEDTDAYMQGLLHLVTVLKRQVNASLPIGRLPPEILCRIFEALKDIVGWPHLIPGHGRMQPATYDDGWIVVTHVCSQWRVTALASALLWTNPIDYSSIPRVLLPLIVQRSQSLPFRLDLRGHSLRALSRVHSMLVSQELLPSALFTRVQDLRIHRFHIHHWKRIESNLQTIPPYLRKLDVFIILPPGSGPLLLPSELCQSSSVTELRLSYCIPSRWNVALFSVHLTRLELRCPENMSAHLLPSAQELATILSTATSLSSINLENVFPPAIPGSEYPLMRLPRTLRTLHIVSTENSAYYRESLYFLARLVFQSPIHLNVGIYEPITSAAYDAGRMRDISFIMSTALNNIYNQQPAPMELIVGDRSFLTHTSTYLGVGNSDWPIAVKPSLFEGHADATSLLSFNLLLPNRNPIFHEGVSAVPLSKLRVLSFLRPTLSATSAAIMSREPWWSALRDARNVHRLGIYIDDCSALLPLAECRLVHDTVTFTMLPHLSTIHIHIDDLLTVETTMLDSKRRACEAGLSCLFALIYSRKRHGAPIKEVVVDVVMEKWEIWDAIASEDVQVRFHEFYSAARSRIRRVNGPATT